MTEKVSFNANTCLRMALNALSYKTEYKWSDETIFKDQAETLKKIRDHAAKLDFENMTVDELKQLGCSVWDEPDENGEIVLLVPLWLLPCLKDGTELYDINNKKVIVGKDTMDNDIRFGCTPQGFKRKAN